MINKPRAASSLIDFVNDLKKSGLFVLGHVKVIENFLELDYDPASEEYFNWLSFIDLLKVKAFVEITIARNVREGLSHLIRISGMGAMKPNTIIFGFHDEAAGSSANVLTNNMSNFHTKEDIFPLQRENTTTLSTDEYVLMISDVLKMRKNLCLCKNFVEFDKSTVVKNVELKNIDVWPINFFNPTLEDAFDTTSLFMLQLACIITMVPDWKNFRLRVFIYDFFDDAHSNDDQNVEIYLNKFKTLLHSLRISAAICRVKDWPKDVPLNSANDEFSSETLSYFKKVNELILRECSSSTAIIFTYLPAPFISVCEKKIIHFNSSENYLRCLTEITKDCPPTIMVHGVHAVTSTTL